MNTITISEAVSVRSTIAKDRQQHAFFAQRPEMPHGLVDLQRDLEEHLEQAQRKEYVEGNQEPSAGEKEVLDPGLHGQRPLMRKEPAIRLATAPFLG